MDEATRNQALDVIMVIITVAALAIGLISMLIGKIAAWRDRSSVNTSVPIMSPAPTRTAPDQQTDEADRRASAGLSVADQWLDRIEVDRTRTAIIELMVYSGWATSEIRSILKGDNGVLGTEIEAAKKKLGIVDEPRQLKIRDEKGERMIPMEAP